MGCAATQAATWLARRVAHETIFAGVDRSLVNGAGVDASTAAEHLGVSAARAHRPVGAVVTATAVVPTDAAGALAGVAVAVGVTLAVGAVDAGEGSTALPTV